MSKILFSPVGMTDPVRGHHDGPMLHIIRHYQPDKVYLFFTAETEEMEKSDGRYSSAIKKLGFKCQVDNIFSSIADPSDFDAFIEIFPKTLDKIIQENRGSELLINISSGTSQMIAALCLEIASNRYNMTPVQVKTPERKSNIGIKTGEYHLDKELEALLDTDSFHYPSRCVIPDIKNFRKALLCSQIKSLIKEYDYYAAINILQSGSSLFSNSGLLANLLNHAKYRLNLQADMAQKYADESAVAFDFHPIKNPDASDLIEYFQTMKIKQKKGELSDFMLRITPIITELAKIYLKRFIDWEDMTFNDDKGIPTFSKKLIQNFSPKIADQIRKEFNFGRGLRKVHFVNLSMLVSIIRSLPFMTDRQKKEECNDQFNRMKNLFGMFNSMEASVRNKTAHEMTLVTEDTLKIKTGKTSSVILDKLETLLELIFPNDFTKDCLIYDPINDLIIKNLR